MKGTHKSHSCFTLPFCILFTSLCIQHQLKSTTSSLLFLSLLFFFSTSLMLSLNASRRSAGSKQSRLPDGEDEERSKPLRGTNPSPSQSSLGGKEIGTDELKERKMRENGVCFWCFSFDILFFCQWIVSCTPCL